jgi:hypothetical protein
LDEAMWREHAAFYITIQQATDADGRALWQTHAHREETGNETTWDGIPDAAMTNWMREQAGLPAAAGAIKAEEAATSPDQTAADLRMIVGDLEVTEISIEREVGAPATRKRMRGQLSFTLAGPAAYPLTASLAPYAIQLLAYSPADDQALALAAGRWQLRAELLDYTQTLDFDLPSVGGYQLVANVLLPDDDLAGVALGPALTVVP